MLSIQTVSREVRGKNENKKAKRKDACALTPFEDALSQMISLNVN
jgi:hypothetical protein